MDRVHRVTQAYSQAPWRKQLQIIGLFLLFLVVAALVAGIYLNVTARAAIIGRDIQGKQKALEALQRENVDLQTRLAYVTSAEEMEKRALAMGFTPIVTDEALYIRVPEYVGRQPAALAPSSQPPLVSAPVLPAEYSESLFEWLAKEMEKPSFPFPIVVVKP
jgi:hypothetical protein